MNRNRWLTVAGFVLLTYGALGLIPNFATDQMLTADSICPVSEPGASGEEFIFQDWTIKLGAGDADAGLPNMCERQALYLSGQIPVIFVAALAGGVFLLRRRK